MSTEFFSETQILQDTKFISELWLWLKSFRKEGVPTFAGKPRVLKENGGKRIVIEIDCDAASKPDIVWMKGSTTLKNEGRFLIDVDDSQKPRYIFILEIDAIVSEDAGIYKCVAKTAKGEASTTAEIKLDGKLP